MMRWLASVDNRSPVRPLHLCDAQMTGAFLIGGDMSRNGLTHEQQIALWRRQGMQIDDVHAAASFLSRVNHYRLSEYCRYWRQSSQRGNARFMEGTSLDSLIVLYEAEQKLGVACFEVLRSLEVLLRARFVYFYARRVGAAGKFARGEGFTQSPRPGAERVEEYPLADLDRSKEAFVAYYRDEIKQGSAYKPEAYDRMPIWVAVEAFSFGSLSRLITASGESGVLDDVADSMNTSRKMLPGQVRSFVYLRNRVAHCSRLWNHSVSDVPGLQPKTSRRVKRMCRNFTEHSVYKILVALDDVASRSGIRSEWLLSVVEPALDKYPLLAQGITQPVRYG